MSDIKEQLVGLGKDAEDICRRFVDAVTEATMAIVDLVNAVDWEALAEAADEPYTEPDENPVRPIGIQKGKWKRVQSKTRRF